MVLTPRDASKGGGVAGLKLPSPNQSLKLVDFVDTMILNVLCDLLFS